MQSLMALMGGGLLTIGVCACESTQEESALIGGQAKASAAAQTLHLGKVDRRVHVADATLLRSTERDAVAVRLTNSSSVAKGGGPLLLEVQEADGKVLYTNATGGLEGALQRLPSLGPHASLWWVDDQVTLAGEPAHVRVRIGSSAKAGGAAALAGTHSISVSGVHLSQQDGLSSVSGLLANPSGRSQGKVAVFAVGLTGGRVRAAGRAIVAALAPHASGVPFQIFLVGNPAGTSIQATAAPVA